MLTVFFHSKIVSFFLYVDGLLLDSERSVVRVKVVSSNHSYCVLSLRE